MDGVAAPPRRMRVRAELATELNQSRFHVLRPRLLAELSTRRMKLGQADVAPIRSKRAMTAESRARARREGESTVIQASRDRPSRRLELPETSATASWRARDRRREEARTRSLIPASPPISFSFLLCLFCRSGPTGGRDAPLAPRFYTLLHASIPVTAPSPQQFFSKIIALAFTCRESEEEEKKKKIPLPPSSLVPSLLISGRPAGPARRRHKPDWLPAYRPTRVTVCGRSVFGCRLHPRNQARATLPLVWFAAYGSAPVSRDAKKELGPGSEDATKICASVEPGSRDAQPGCRGPGSLGHAA
jgi:hypothetical protein